MLCAPPTIHAQADEKLAVILLVQRIKERFKQVGAAETFSAITAKTFNQGNVFPFVYDMNGVNFATGGSQVLIGKTLISVRDQDGRYLIREMIAIAQGPGSGWLEYKWPNPVTRQLEDKSTYVEKMGDFLVAVGIYRTPPMTARQAESERR